MSDTAAHDDLKSYWLALGEFISRFAAVEEAVLLLLWRQAQVRIPVAQSVFSGVRAEGAFGFVRRILEATNPDPALLGELQHVQAQFTIINGVRNDIVHYGARFGEGGEMEVTTELAAHIASRLRRTVVSPDILRQMTTDLQKIQLHLNLFGRREMVAKRQMELFEKVLNAAWLYKPQQERAAGQSPHLQKKIVQNRSAGRSHLGGDLWGGIATFAHLAYPGRVAESR